MDAITLEWAGRERDFRLTFGGVLDLEAACDCGIGAIYLRLASGQFRITDVFETLRFGLLGGGMSAGDAKRLVKERFEHQPIMQSVEVALEVMIASMTGVENSDGEKSNSAGKAEDRHQVTDVMQLCQLFNMTPEDLRATRYSDIVNLIRGHQAAGGSAPHITEEEFDEILAKYEPVDSDG